VQAAAPASAIIAVRLDRFAGIIVFPHALKAGGWQSCLAPPVLQGLPTLEHVREIDRWP
jgi:hypothetical protein